VENRFGQFFEDRIAQRATQELGGADFVGLSAAGRASILATGRRQESGLYDPVREFDNRV